MGHEDDGDTSFNRCNWNCPDKLVWHNVGHSFLWVWVNASQIPLSVLARNSHKELAREISHETGRRRGKARFQRSEQKKAVSRRGQSTEVGGSRRSEKGDCWDLWTQRSGWPTWEDESAFLWEFRSNTRSREPTCTESYAKVSQTSTFFNLELT